jgi:hypothetical protein
LCGSQLDMLQALSVPVEQCGEQVYGMYLNNFKQISGALPVPEEFDGQVTSFGTEGQKGNNVCGYRTIKHIQHIQKYFRQNKIVTSDSLRKAAHNFMQKAVFNGKLADGISVENVRLCEVEELLPKLELSSGHNCPKELIFGEWVKTTALFNDIYCTYVDGIQDQVVGYIKPDDVASLDFDKQLASAEQCKRNVAQKLAQLNNITADGVILFPFLRLASTHWLLLWVEKHSCYPPMICMVDSLSRADLANRPDVQFFIRDLFSKLQPGRQAFKEYQATLLSDELLMLRLSEQEDELFAHDAEKRWQEQARLKREKDELPQREYDKALAEFVQSTDWDTNRWVGWSAWQARRLLAWR